MRSGILKQKERLHSEKSVLFLFKTEIAILRLWDCKRLKMQLK